VAALVTLIGALLAAIISGTNLTFELWPGLKPDPKEKVGADLKVLAIDKNVEHDDYGHRPGKRVPVGRRMPVGAEGEDLGNVFYLRAQIEGFKRQTLHLKWFTYNPNGERRKGTRQKAAVERVFEPEAPINTQVAQVWVREPGGLIKGKWESQAGQGYFVRFELYRGDVLLAYKDSRRFSVE
jgi:hypothetical protein